MKLFLKQVGKYLAVAYIIASSVSFVLDYSLTHSRFYKFYLDGSEENLRNAELLVFGGSRAMAGIDSQMLAKETGLKTYNVGVDDTGVASHLLLLKMLWKRGIRPRYIVLEYLNSESRSHWGWSPNDLRLLPLILTDADVRAYTKQNQSAAFAYAHMALPFFKYSYYNEELFFPALYTLASKASAYRSDAYGDYSYPPDTTSDNGQYSTISTDALNTSCEEYREFVQFCLDKGIKIVTFVAPIEGKHLYTADNGVVNFTYLDLPADDYYDSMHLNARGKEKVGKMLAAHLKTRLANSDTLN